MGVAVTSSPHFLILTANAVVLKLAPTPGGVTVSWPSEATNYILEATSTLPTVSWATVTNTPADTATERNVQLPLAAFLRFCLCARSA
jgi:hypothetical protein